jgi:hypothetical protein
MITHGKTINEAAANLEQLRRYAPYRFGGKWFIAVLNGEAYAYRSKRDLLSKARKLLGDGASIEIAII